MFGGGHMSRGCDQEQPALGANHSYPCLSRDVGTAESIGRKTL
jgi:hypothetical protein